MNQLSYELRRFRSFLWNNSEPVTRTILAINVFTFLVFFIAAFFLRAGNPWEWLTFSTAAPWLKPWAFLTYPLVTYEPFTLLFAGYWLWIVGGALERSWTSSSFLRFFAGVTAATSVGLWVGGLLLGASGLEQSGVVQLSSLWLPLAALTVAWCLLNPNQIVLLGFVLPIPGRVLMWITIALTYFWFAMGFGAPWLGFFALSGVGTAYLYTRRRLERYAFGHPRTARNRPPTAAERALDWVLFRWERVRRRLFRR